MSEPRADRCETCRYWHPPDPEDDPDGTELGECRRRAPVPQLFDDRGFPSLTARWSDTDRTDWCGEFAPLPHRQRVEAPAGEGS